MSDAPELYRHSGVIPPVGGLLALLGTVIGAGVVGRVYAQLQDFVFWEFLEVLPPVIFGYAAGAAASWLSRLGKIRNPDVPTALGIFAGALALYVAWAFDAVVRDLGGFSLSPSYVWDYMALLSEAGTLKITFLGADEPWIPRGALLYALWLLEACAFVGAAWWGSKDAIEGAVFCEPCERWTEVSFGAHAASREVYDSLIDSLMGGAAEVLGGPLGVIRPRDHVRIDLNSCPGCTESNYVTFVRLSTQIKEDSRGGRTETEIERPLGPPLKIPAHVTLQLPKASPAWLARGLEAPPAPPTPSDSIELAPTRLRRKKRREEFESAEYPRARAKVRGQRHQAPPGIALHCPHCDAQTRIPREFAGRQGKCPRCKGPVTVPER